LAATFTIEFRSHLKPEEISNLKGILGAFGIGQSESLHNLRLEVYRKAKVPQATITLKNWNSYSWLDWSVDPAISN
jgi:hypothetical protein